MPAIRRRAEPPSRCARLVTGRVSPILPTRISEYMTRGLEAPVNPQLLIWARETAGLSVDDAAKKMNIAPAKLEGVEAGHEGQHLTFSQLKTAATAYKRPVAAFFLPEPPAVRHRPLHDFRLHQDAPLGYSPRLNFEIRSAQAHRDDLIELAAEMDEDVGRFGSSLQRDTAPNRAAAYVRELIGIDIDTQLRWRSPETALKCWKAALEHLGILIFEASNIPLSEMRGFSIPSDELPIIVLNGGDTHTGRVFTLFHEITHLLLNDGGVCDLYVPNDDKSPDMALEMYCNAVAAEFLVPEAVLRRIAPGNGIADWNEESLSTLARTFSVSREVILRRLLTLGRTTKAFYQEMREQYKIEFERAKEAARNKPNKAGPSPSVMAVRNLGKPFVRTVLEAYSQEKISLSKVSDYLGVKVRHLDRIGQLVGSKVI